MNGGLFVLRNLVWAVTIHPSNGRRPQPKGCLTYSIGRQQNTENKTVLSAVVIRSKHYNWSWRIQSACSYGLVISGASRFQNQVNDRVFVNWETGVPHLRKIGKFYPVPDRNVIRRKIGHHFFLVHPNLISYGYIIQSWDVDILQNNKTVFFRSFVSVSDCSFPIGVIARGVKWSTRLISSVPPDR